MPPKQRNAPCGCTYSFGATDSYHGSSGAGVSLLAAHRKSKPTRHMRAVVCSRAAEEVFDLMTFTRTLVGCRSMRIVIDTNVMISALLNPGRVPDLVLAQIRRRGDVVLYDARILCEIRSVLSRPKFAFSTERVEGMVTWVLALGQDVGEVDRWPTPMTDDDDRVFVEVAIAGKADVLLTGNAKHYPRDLGFEVVGPTALLGWLEADSRG